MPLVLSPSSILGSVIPHPGLAPSSINHMLINGISGWTEDVGDALTDVRINWDIDGTSYIILQIEDPHRNLLRAQMSLQRTVITVDGINFVMADISKSGPQLTLTFEHAVCSRLKDHVETASVHANTMSRTDFVKKLVAYEPWISVLTPGGGSPQNSVTLLSVGNVDAVSGGAIPLGYTTSFQERETFWDAAATILSTIGWRRFPLGANQLVLASDQWLYAQTPIAILDEASDGVDTIDFDYDIRKPLGSLTINCRAAAWAFPVGSVIQIGEDMGIVGIQSNAQPRLSSTGNLPPIAGHWLVTNISRSLMSASATIKLDTPLLTMSEVQTQPVTSPAGQVYAGLHGGGTVISGNSKPAAVTSVPGGVQTGKNPSSLVSKFLSVAAAQEGKPYVYAADGPNTFDCSGLVKFAAAAIGVSLPHNSQEIYNACVAAGTQCTAETALATPGALLILSVTKDISINGPTANGHIGISLGGGMSIQAMDQTAGIHAVPIGPGFFDLGGLLPGVKY